MKVWFHTYLVTTGDLYPEQTNIYHYSPQDKEYKDWEQDSFVLGFGLGILLSLADNPLLNKLSPKKSFFQHDI